MLMVIMWLRMVHNNLVGGIPTPVKNDGVRQLGCYSIPNIWKTKKCSKPPTSSNY